MASNYTHKGTSLTSIGVVANTLTKKLTSNTTFTLADYGFTDTDTTEYCKAATYNSGTWGVSKDSLYMNNGTPLPFIDVNSIPHPFVDTSASTYYVEFPTEDTTNNGTSIKYIAASQITSALTISYSSSTSTLSAACGSTSLLNVKASPYILIGVQGAGGSGGSGHGGNYATSLVTVSVHMGGGGGGGSGGFALLSANTKNTTVTVTPHSGTYYITSSNDSSQLTLRVHKGGDGGNAGASSMNDADGWATVTSHSGGAGGTGGTVAVYNARGNQTDASPVDKTMGDMFVVDYINGGNGGTGVDEYGSWSSRPTGQGTQGNTLGTYNLYLSSGHQYLECHKYGTSSKSTGGWGEQNTSWECFGGGGGGAASLMADGASHGSAGSLGSGGCGGSAWTNSRSSSDDATGSAGGSGAVWIFYVPIICSHEYSDYVLTQVATCTTEGTLTRTCAVCKTQETQSLPALGHSYVETDRIDATETETGSITYTCERCARFYTETIDALGYEFINSTGYNMWDEQGFTADGRIKANTTVTFKLYTAPMINPTPFQVRVTNADLDSYDRSTGECSISNATGTVEIKAVNIS